MQLWRRSRLEAFRLHLSRGEALPQLALLAAIVGLLTGAVILMFRMAIDLSLAPLLSGPPDGFESLPQLERLALPVLGAALLALVFGRLPAESLRVGVAHVMERLSRHQGYMPLRNALVQFFGGIIALASGMSGGREGPAVHLGAACSSLLGQRLQLPNNIIRTLVACGTAAAIAGSFNTPMAGVIFAMEVVMMEYTIKSFIPVIVAAVTATLLTHMVIGPEPAFEVAALQLNSLLEVPYIVLCGLVIGTVAAGYIRLVQQFARLQSRPFWLRALLAGAITGIAAIAAPQVMGVGYDTVNSAMVGQIALLTLLAVALLKSLTSAAAVGLGMPVGIIGPTLVIGATLGGAMGIIGAELQPEQSASSGFYVMLGMAAMMAAVLQAPLAALVAVLELTANPNVILPAMLIIVVATMTTSVPFRQPSVFLSTLKTLGLQYPPNPVRLHLQRAGVTAIMNRSLVQLESTCSMSRAHEALTRKPRWILVETAPGRVRSVLSAGDLTAYLEQHEQRNGGAEVDLLEIPGARRDAADVDFRATLDQAQDLLSAPGIEALCVRQLDGQATASATAPVRGVVTQEDIDNYRESAQ
ncbi:MAG: chloride channel protein [Pseudomonadales bacterium]